MDKSAEILEELTVIFRYVFDNNNIVIGPQTTANDISEWDSLSYLQLIVTIEKHFKIRFMSSDIQNFKTVGEICQTIYKKSIT